MKIRLADGSGSFDLKYLFEETLPSGRTRIRFRRHGVKVTLRSTPGTDEFMQEYRRALDGITVSTPLATTRERTRASWNRIAAMAD
jgi:hypothetical protein